MASSTDVADSGPTAVDVVDLLDGLDEEGSEDQEATPVKAKSEITKSERYTPATSESKRTEGDASEGEEDSGCSEGKEDEEDDDGESEDPSHVARPNLVGCNRCLIPPRSICEIPKVS